MKDRVASVKGKTRGLNAMDRQGSEMQVEGLTPMDRGNDKEQARLRSMNQ